MVTQEQNLNDSVYEDKSMHLASLMSSTMKAQQREYRPNGLYKVLNNE
jgi:hypothetical protein